jgi:short-subunit dehydrogenase
MTGLVKTAVVTGASRGIGRSISEAFLARGWRVVGTSRKPEKMTPLDKVAGVTYRALDLTDGASIEGFARSLERVDVLINNAGASQMGPVEDVPIERARQLFELVFFGPVGLIQGILPLMRTQGGGRIINITSFASHTPVPFSALYAAGKSALETLTLGLRSEVRKYGIQISAVAPTFVKTGIFQEKLVKDGSSYANDYTRVKAIRDAGIAKGCNPSVVAAKVLQVVECSHPAAFYAVGPNAAIMTFMHRFCPSGLMERVVRSHFVLNRDSGNRLAKSNG